MSFFEVEREDLKQLTDAQLEELVARLAEAEVASQGFSPSCVHWSGSTDAPDGGVDVRVAVSSDSFEPGFVPRSNSIFQAKTRSMPPARIAKEMRPRGSLLPSIAEQAQSSGAYVIVSTKDKFSESRIGAMHDALKREPGAGDIRLDFYDRSKLLQWLRQHPAVALWVRDVLGKPLSGWSPYGRWSNPPKDADDSLILEKGVTITLPADRHERLDIKDAIAPLRKLVRSSGKAIRVVGLSGVGKTRIVQALFDATMGDDPLDRTSAVYAELGADPDPSANSMLERLLADGRTTYLVLDNCPSSLHGTLASRFASVESKVRLITVEYDIREDQPQSTEVVHVVADGPDVAEELIVRRHPGIGSGNAHRIAKFAKGNARVALAVAERVRAGESLAKLSDEALFDRLFSQRNEPDGQLRQHARLLSLVYSFSVQSPDEDTDELAVLGSIQGIPRHQLFDSVADLLERQVAQKRSHWRAILPHAVANRLAEEALSHIPRKTLRTTFEAPGRERLLTSFARRLGLLHDHDVAKGIVLSWLDEDGPLASVSGLSENGLMMLQHVTPTAPGAVLDRLAAEIEAPEFVETERGLDSSMATMLGLLTSLAYEPDTFDRCARLLLRLADSMKKPASNGPVGDTLVENAVVRFFQPYLSGTHASLDQRKAVLIDALNSNDHRRRSLGLRMLSTALDGPPWHGNGVTEFGARPRDFGYHPNRDELVAWYRNFIDVAVVYGMRMDDDLARQARQTLAQEFRGLWAMPEMRERLTSAALELHAVRPWTEGWKAVRKTMFFDYEDSEPGRSDEDMPQELKRLEKRLAPSGLMARIDTFVLGHDNDPWSLDEEFHDKEANDYDESAIRCEQRATELGREFACSEKPVAALGARLLSNDYMPYRRAFGRGLAADAHRRQALWDDLASAAAQTDSRRCDLAVLAGFIEQVDSEDRPCAQRILDQCLGDQRLGRELVRLHPAKNFEEGDLERCMRALEVPKVNLRNYGDLFWKVPYASLPADKLHELAARILAIPVGEEVLLEALARKLHRECAKGGTLDGELKRLGLIAATKRLLNNGSVPAGVNNHDVQQVLRASLQSEGNEKEKSGWLVAIFDLVDGQVAMLRSFKDVVRLTAELMPDEFLNRVFTDDDERRLVRSRFIERETFGTTVLSGIDAGPLIAWCETRNDPEAWKAVASGLRLWVSTDDEDAVRISDTAVRFLEASPAPGEILTIYASKIPPRSWTGSRADTMARRTAYFKTLFKHKDSRISTTAQEIVKEAMKKTSIARQGERREDEEREQRFE